MKVLFVFVSCYTIPCWSPAIQALSSVLKAHGHETSLVYVGEGFVPDKINTILSEVKKQEPFDLIAFSCTSLEYGRVKQIASAVKRRYTNILVILGGTHSTIKPDDLGESPFDAFCLGEGEEALLELVERLEKGENYYDVQNFHFKTRLGQIIKNHVRPFIKDLNILPFWDWEVIDTRKLLAMRKGWLGVTFSRGCPCNCSFCVNETLREIKGREGYTRRRSVANVIAELKFLVETYPATKVVNFEDDLLVQDWKWISDFGEQFKREIYEKTGIKYKIESRVDVFNERLAKALSESGCQEVQFGVETANPGLLKILNKGTNQTQIINSFKLCDKYKMKTMAFLMFGIPTETEDTVLETLDLMVKVKAGLTIANFYYPIRGTRLYNHCIEHGLFRKNASDYGDYRRDSILKLPTISHKKLVWYGRLWPWHLNAHMGLTAYADAALKFHDVRAGGMKRSREIILKTDRKLDAITRVLHYRFFGFKPNYTERVDSK